jgi:exopolysaccharide production protein ExoQ
LPTRAADRTALLIIAMLLLVAFAAGGGGARYGLANLAVQLAALGALAMRPDSVWQFWRGSPLMLRIAILAAFAIPLAQIIPLPEPVWSALPGRELVSRSLALVGGSEGWRPLSVDPLRTLLALTALITPLAVLSAGWTLDRDRLIDLGWLTVALGLFTVLLGAAQLSAPSDSATLYGSRAPGEILLGTFANRNSTGLFLTFALGLAAVLPAPRPHPAILPARIAACALLLLAVVLTQSRTALVLALLPVLLGVARAAGWRAGERGGKRGAIIVLGAAALLAAGLGAVLTAAPGRIGATLERFEAKDDPRRFIWDDASFIAGRYWPAGAGVGSFDEIYQVDESLENLSPRRPGRAHNDFIELTIEAGAPGLVVMALWLLLIGWLSWKARASRRRWVAWAGSTFLLAIALQSVTDYPLRNQTILAVAAFALLLLVRVATEERSERT